MCCSFLQIFLILLSVIAYQSNVNAALLKFHINSVPRTPHPSEISPEIINELRDFLDLIPTATVDEIVAKHYIIDGEFRKALKFVKSDEIKQLLQRAQEIPEIIQILDFLHLTNGNRIPSRAVMAAVGKGLETENALPEESRNTQVVEDSVAPVRMAITYGIEMDKPAVKAERNGIQMEFVLLEFGSDIRHHNLSATHNLHTFSTFVEELLEHLPRDRYVQMINTKRQQSSVFAQFYAALRNAELRPMIETAMKSKNLANIINTLQSHAIDGNALLPIAFDVISWGPTP